MLNEYLDTAFVTELWEPQSILYFSLSIIVLLVAKQSYALLAPYHLGDQLTKVDNKAIAITFAGYLFATGLILVSVLHTEPLDSSAAHALVDWAYDASITLGWCFFGVALLHVGRLVNDKLIFRSFSDNKELVEDKNLGLGAAECGSYIGTGLIIKGALWGDIEVSFVSSLVSTVVFFVFGQLLFIAFSFLYQKVTRYDLHEEIENDNPAAGLAAGMNLVAIGLIISSYIQSYDSVIGLLVFSGLALFFLLVSRYLVDKWMLPGSLLDEEIKRDRNWGAALIEGTSAITLAFALIACFL